LTVGVGPITSQGQIMQSSNISQKQQQQKGKGTINQRAGKDNAIKSQYFDLTNKHNTCPTLENTTRSTKRKVFLLSTMMSSVR
jgi:hypothetical protein